MNWIIAHPSLFLEPFKLSPRSVKRCFKTVFYVGAAFCLPYFTMFSGRGQRFFLQMLNGWPPGTSNYTAAFAHRKRSKDGHQVHYELVRIQIRPLSFDTPDIWALLPFFPPLYRCGSQNHRHSTYFCLSRSSWAFLKIKDLVLVFKELCLEGGWRAFLLPSAGSFTRGLPIKRNGRPGFHESAILLLRQGIVAGTTLAVIPCLFLSAMPCILSDKTLENNRHWRREVNKIYLKIHFLSSLFPRAAKNSRPIGRTPSAGVQLVKDLFEVLF